jgi:tetratricopeptide (TPR) repeat protein
LAFSVPYWLNSLEAEVYSLHALLVCLLLFFLLIWREKKDVRYLFAAAILFGLGSGNHATIAFLLPTILILYFAWNKEFLIRNLGVSILFFLIGISVYSYLPVRSMTEPSLDWGNPETVDGFLFQVMDQKDKHLHFSSLKPNPSMEGSEADSNPLITNISGKMVHIWNKSLKVTRGFFRDINQFVSPVLSVGFVIGAIICFRKDCILFFALLIMVAINAAFFVGWGQEAFFSSYIVVCMFSSLAIFQLLIATPPFTENRNNWFLKINPLKILDRMPQIDWRLISLVGIICLIPYNIMHSYFQVDRSKNYFGDTIFKSMFLSLENRSVLLAGVSWFHSYYYNDILRLRDDVTQINVWDLMNDDPFQYITEKRYPDLSLPDPRNYKFDSRENANHYILELFQKNYNDRPIIIEQNQTFFSQIPAADQFEPSKNIYLKYVGPREKSFSKNTTNHEFKEFSRLIEKEMQKPGFQSQNRWIEPIAFYINSFAKYYRDRQHYGDERKVLQVMHDFLGSGGRKWHLRMIGNLVLDQKHDEALSLLKVLKEKFPKSYETHVSDGILLRSSGKLEAAVKAFTRATNLDSESYFPHFQMALIYQKQGKLNEAKIQFNLATGKIKTMRELQLLRKGSLSK